MNFIITIYFWIYFLITSIILLPVAAIMRLITYPGDKSLSALHRLTAFWGRVFVWGNPLWKFTISGQENVDSSEHYVMVSNHQSMIDIFILYQIKHQYKWVAKAELFKTPFFGQALSLNNYIKLNRSNRSSMLHMMKQCNEVLKHTCSVMIFPEGTRSLTGEIGIFKNSAFKLAVDTGKKVLPIILDETMNSLPKKGFVFNKTNRFKIKILPAIDSSNISYKELSDKCRKRMIDGLTELRSTKI